MSSPTCKLYPAGSMPDHIQDMGVYTMLQFPDFRNSKIDSQGNICKTQQQGQKVVDGIVSCVNVNDFKKVINDQAGAACKTIPYNGGMMSTTSCFFQFGAVPNEDWCNQIPDRYSI
jgi:hypothetical protein